MYYRRKHLADLVLSNEGDGIRTGFAWFRNSVLWGVTGYGEYPLRVIGSSVAIIMGFAGIYGLLGDTGGSVSDFILYSFQSFITFIIASPPQETTQAVATLSIIEGFTGAFFIALFVYTFTRRLNR